MHNYKHYIFSMSGHVLLILLLGFSFNRGTSATWPTNTIDELIATNTQAVVPVKADLIAKSDIDAAIKRQELRQQKQQQAEYQRIQNIKRQEKAASMARAAAKREQQQALALKQKNEKLSKETEALKRDLEQQKTKLRQDLRAERDKLRKGKEALKAKQHELAAQKVQNEISRYMHIIQQQVSSNWATPIGMSRELACILEIFLTEDGSVQDVRLSKTSGNPAYDKLAMRTVWDSSPLQLPDSSQARQKFLHFNFKFQPGS